MNEQQIEQAERYLQGEMSEAEKVLFEQEMEANAELREWIAVEKQIISGIKKAAHQERKEQLKALHQEIYGPSATAKERPGRVISLPWIGIAASLLLAIGCFWFFWPRDSEPVEDDFIGGNPNAAVIATFPIQYVDASGQVTRDTVGDILVFEVLEAPETYEFNNIRLRIYTPDTDSWETGDLEVTVTDEEKAILEKGTQRFELEIGKPRQALLPLSGN